MQRCLPFGRVLCAWHAVAHGIPLESILQWKAQAPTAWVHLGSSERERIHDAWHVWLCACFVQDILCSCRMVCDGEQHIVAAPLAARVHVTRFAKSALAHRTKTNPKQLQITWQFVRAIAHCLPLALVHTRQCMTASFDCPIRNYIEPLYSRWIRANISSPLKWKMRINENTCANTKWIHLFSGWWYDSRGCYCCCCCCRFWSHQYSCSCCWHGVSTTVYKPTGVSMCCAQNACMNEFSSVLHVRHNTQLERK